jgi:hypothetical protein
LEPESQRKADRKDVPFSLSIEILPPTYAAVTTSRKAMNAQRGYQTAEIFQVVIPKIPFHQEISSLSCNLGVKLTDTNDNGRNANASRLRRATAWVCTTVSTLKTWVGFDELCGTVH